MTVEVPDVAAARTLTAEDRCARCGAQALVITEHEAGDLLWCAHHFHQHEDALSSRKVLDRRGTLLSAAQRPLRDDRR